MSELSLEEKEAIERLNKRYEFFKENPLATNVWLTLDIHNLGILLNLIEKQQKEIKNLKKPRYLYNAHTGEITKLENSNCISKDKIKVILEEYKYTEIGDSEKIIEFYKKMQSLLKGE